MQDNAFKFQNPMLTLSELRSLVAIGFLQGCKSIIKIYTNSLSLSKQEIKITSNPPEELKVAMH